MTESDQVLSHVVMTAHRLDFKCQEIWWARNAATCLKFSLKYGSHATGWDVVVPGIAVVLALSWLAPSIALNCAQPLGLG
jgi:hypothetical protein